MRQLMNRFGKVLAIAVLAAAGLWLAAPCAQAQAKEIKELVIAIGVDADTLNPQEQTTTLIQNMCDLIYDNFFFQDPTGKLHPRLATKYEISPDGLTYTLHLQGGQVLRRHRFQRRRREADFRSHHGPETAGAAALCDRHGQGMRQNR